MRYDTVIIGGGQAGLATAYHLRGRDVLVVDAADRIGATWENRWDSLRLFTPAHFTHLPGLPFPAAPGHLPTKDEMAAYLRTYAERFCLPVRLGRRVTRLAADPDGYRVEFGDRSLTARSVVVATGPAMTPRVPDVEVTVPALHSSEYRNPGQLPDGPVLVAGAGNSGAEIALDLAPTRRVWLAGRPPGRFPMTIGGPVYRAMNRLLTAETRLGRRIAAGSSGRGTPLVRVRERDLRKAGVTRGPRVVGAAGARHVAAAGLPLLADGRVLDVAAIVWATGYRPDYSWIDLPGIPDDGPPPHELGVVADHPGLFFVGLPFQSSMSSSLVGGVGRDAAHIARSAARAVRV